MSYSLVISVLDIRMNGLSILLMTTLCSIVSAECECRVVLHGTCC